MTQTHQHQNCADVTLMLPSNKASVVNVNVPITTEGEALRARMRIMRYKCTKIYTLRGGMTQKIDIES
jgi:hypothetical protein